MVHYLKESRSLEAVIEHFTYFQLFWHCKRDFLDQLKVFNCFSVSWIIICIRISSYFEFQDDS